jgi:hypothetical protein
MGLGSTSRSDREESIGVDGQGVTDPSNRQATDGEGTAGMPDSSVKLQATRRSQCLKEHRCDRQAFCGSTAELGRMIFV